MRSESLYWTFAQINPPGGHRIQELSQAKDFFQTQIKELAANTEISDRVIQAHLFNLSTAPDPALEALLCLRCFISHKILQACQLLETRFGAQHQFKYDDLLPFVLTDPGKINEFAPSNDESQPRPPAYAYKILNSFHPEKGELGNWTIRLVKDNKELNQYLLQQGLYRMTDWGLLNNFKRPQFEHILQTFYHYNNSQIEQAIVLLESYHAIYTQDWRSSGKKGRCPIPTKEQLQKINHLIQQKTQTPLKNSTLLAQLKEIAKLLREYSIKSKGGNPANLSIHIPKVAQLIQNQQSDPQTDDITEFSRDYQKHFLDVLDQAIAEAIRDRLNNKTATKRDRYLKAMRLYYCDQVSQSEIATQLNLNDQSSVSHLLDLRSLQAQVRRIMLKLLKPLVRQLASVYCNAERLEKLDGSLDTLLNQQIDLLLDEETKRAKTPKHYGGDSLFAERMCLFLDQETAT
ncbi:hypothetical protein Q2T42_19830 [Leptolyngbya boryana CZ1]|uniref:Uncharacterized protein n=1 Tax=Leptolyngbya boryana CZ1 TaxID=3060204 RepID=A0AA96WQP7_LEPBY|nr:hypothetical protein [Leptolyngbya boryana]WNZ44082.1 hypothetical protein Q2T42_19830 [Leptolyngbya boryana CZ1]